MTRTIMQVRAARPSEYDEVVELVRAAFQPGDAAEAVVATTIQHDSRFRPDCLRVVEDGGRIVGAVNLIDRWVRMGSVQARCAIVAPLAVVAERRGTGVGSSLMRDSLAWARAEDFELSMLWGHTWLYPRYGYAPGLKHYRVRVPPQLQPRGDGPYSLRPFSAGDTTALQQVYHTETATMTLAEVRSNEPWEWRPLRPEVFVDVAVDPARAVRGYMRGHVDNHELLVGELFAMDTGAAQALFDWLLHLARTHGCAGISVTATPHNRWSRLAVAHGAELCVSSGGGAGMVRVLDWPRLLATLLPELERRISKSDYVLRRMEAQIETPAGRAMLILQQGRLELRPTRSANAATLPFHALGPLITGYLPIAELVDLPGVFIRGKDTQRFLDILFPEGSPHWSLPAYFS